MDPRQLQSLNGPIAFYYYPNIRNKRIVLLSDIHIHGRKCEDPYGVVDWIKDLSQFEDIDFFVEQSYIKEPITKITNYSSTNTLSEIINTYEPYYINNKYVKIDHLRYHYIDVRSFKLGAKGTIYLFTPVNPLSKKLLSNKGYLSNTFNIENHINNLEDMILYMMGENNNAYFN